MYALLRLTFIVLFSPLFIIIDGAYATFEENEKGSVTPGKLADFVVLRKDPRKVARDALKDIVVEATYIGEKKVWQAP